jgi:crotonobetainyl-CoA:carnitine CoA-transferase CaiB-like acyl-CoA transferase
MEQLQSIEIAAGVVQDIEDLMEHDPQIRSRNALLSLDHPLLGPFAHVRTPASFSRSTTEPFRAPAIGEHGEQIAATICGLNDARVAELKALGVFR